MTITTVGIDLAKNVFAVHCIDQNGKAVLVKPKVSRAALSELIAGLPPCVIGMEACSGAHYWARLFRQYGHDVRLMAPKFVSPYRMAGKTGKNDAADAIAICEAVQRPHMRFVPVKDESQQAMQCLHRTRQGFIQERTATYNGSADKFLDLQELIYAFIRGPDSGRRTLLPVRKESLRCRHGAGISFHKTAGPLGSDL